MMTEEKKRTLLEIIRNKKRVLARKTKQRLKKALLMGGLLGALSMTTKSVSAQSPVKDKKINKKELLADAVKPNAAKMAEFMMYASVDVDETINDIVENDILTFQQALEKKYAEIARFKGNKKAKFGGGQNYCAMIPSKVFNEVAVRDSMEYVKDLYGSLSNPNLCSAVRDDMSAMFPEHVTKRQKVSEMKNLKNGDFLIVDMRNARAGQANTSSGLHFVTYFEGKFYALTSKLDKDNLTNDEAFATKAKGEILSVNRESYKSFDDSYFSGRYGWKISTKAVLTTILKEKIQDLPEIEQKKYVFNQSSRVDEKLDNYRENKAEIKKIQKKKTLLAKERKIQKRDMENITLASAGLSIATPPVSIDIDQEKITEQMKAIQISRSRGGKTK